MPGLSEKDREIIRRLQGRMILQDIDGHRLDLLDGITMVACADCRQRADMFSHQERIFMARGLDPNIQPLTLNGGALLIPLESPLNDQFKEDAVLRWHIAVARVIKGIHTIALYAHVPCGAAYLFDIDVEQVVDLLVLAKRRLKLEIDEYTRTVRDLLADRGKVPYSLEIPTAKVACFLHVDWDSKNKKTYFVSGEKWSSWYAERGIRYPQIGYREAALTGTE